MSNPSGLLDVLDVSCIQSRRIRSDPSSTFPRKWKGITAWRSPIAAMLQGWTSSAACPTPLRPPSRHVPAFLRPFIRRSENPLRDCTPVIWPGECTQVTVFAPQNAAAVQDGFVEKYKQSSQSLACPRPELSVCRSARQKRHELGTRLARRVLSRWTSAFLSRVLNDIVPETLLHNNKILIANERLLIIATMAVNVTTLHPQR